MSSPRYQFGERERRNVETLLAMAIAEDFDQAGDITTAATIPSRAQGAGRLVARSPGVLAGLPVIERLAAEFELIANGNRIGPMATASSRGWWSPAGRTDEVAAGHGADGAQLPPAAQRDRDLDGAVRLGDRRHPLGDL